MSTSRGRPGAASWVGSPPRVRGAPASLTWRKKPINRTARKLSQNRLYVLEVVFFSTSVSCSEIIPMFAPRFILKEEAGCIRCICKLYMFFFSFSLLVCYNNEL